MINLPIKRYEQIEGEELAVAFVKPLKKFISELIARDDYSPLKKKGDKLDVLAKAAEDPSALEDFRKKIAAGEDAFRQKLASMRA